jgi:hypothetical protein
VNEQETPKVQAYQEKLATVAFGDDAAVIGGTRELHMFMDTSDSAACGKMQVFRTV